MQRGDAAEPPVSQEEWDAEVQMFLSKFSNPETRRVRYRNLRDFCGGVVEARVLSEFARAGRAAASRRGDAFFKQATDSGMANSTASGRRSTIEHFSDFLCQRGWMSFEDEPERRRSTRSKRGAPGEQDTAQPSNEGLTPEVVEQLLQEPDADTESGARDASLLCLMALDGLSRLQAIMVNARDFNAELGQLAVLPLRQARSLSARLARQDKAQAEMEGESDTEANAPDTPYFLDLHPQTREALRKYLEMSRHEEEEGAPLLCTLHRGRRSGPASKRRLTQDGIYGIVASYAKKIGHPEINSRRLQKVAAACASSPPPSPQPNEQATREQRHIHPLQSEES